MFQNQKTARKYAFMLALNISTGEDPEADESKEQDEPPIQCKKCGKEAIFEKAGEFEGKPVKCYRCNVCKSETRKAAA